MNERVPEIDQEQLQKPWEEAQRAQEYWAMYYREFLKQKRYRYKFLAVKDEQVVAYSKDLIKLMRKLEKRNLMPTEVWVMFITDQPRQLMH